MADAASDSEALAAGPVLASPAIRTHERRVGLLVLCLLALAVGVVTGVRRRGPARADRDLPQRLVSTASSTSATTPTSLKDRALSATSSFLSPIIGGLIVVWIVETFAPEAKGHGVPEVMDSVFYKEGDIRWQVAVVKSLASALSIGTGAAVGREGPIIQIGAALGSAFSQVDPARALAESHPALGRRRRRHRRDLQHAARRRAVRARNPAAGSVQPHIPAGRRSRPARPPRSAGC